MNSVDYIVTVLLYIRLQVKNQFSKLEERMASVTGWCRLWWLDWPTLNQQHLRSSGCTRGTYPILGGYYIVCFWFLGIVVQTLQSSPNIQMFSHVLFRKENLFLWVVYLSFLKACLNSVTVTVLCNISQQVFSRKEFPIFLAKCQAKFFERDRRRDW